MLASLMKSARHFASPSIAELRRSAATIAALRRRARRAGQAAGRLAVGAELDARRAGGQAERVERRLVHARAGDAAAR